MKINELIEKAHENAVKHGFWEDFSLIKDIVDEIDCLDEYDKVNKILKTNAICTRLTLIHDEVSEATEGLRKNDIANFKEELADIAIRLADLVGGLNIDLEGEIKKKMKINHNRPYKHGKQF